MVRVPRTPLGTQGIAPSPGRAQLAGGVGQIERAVGNLAGAIAQEGTELLARRTKAAANKEVGDAKIEFARQSEEMTLQLNEEMPDGGVKRSEEFNKRFNDLQKGFNDNLSNQLSKDIFSDQTFQFRKASLLNADDSARKAEFAGFENTLNGSVNVIANAQLENPDLGKLIAGFDLIDGSIRGFEGNWLNGETADNFEKDYKSRLSVSNIESNIIKDKFAAAREGLTALDRFLEPKTKALLLKKLDVAQRSKGRNDNSLLKVQVASDRAGFKDGIVLDTPTLTNRVNSVLLSGLNEGSKVTSLATLYGGNAVAAVVDIAKRVDITESADIETQVETQFNSAKPQIIAAACKVSGAACKLAKEKPFLNQVKEQMVDLATTAIQQLDDNRQKNSSAAQANEDPTYAREIIESRGDPIRMAQLNQKHRIWGAGKGVRRTKIVPPSIESEYIQNMNLAINGSSAAGLVNTVNAIFAEQGPDGQEAFEQIATKKNGIDPRYAAIAMMPDENARIEFATVMHKENAVPFQQWFKDNANKDFRDEFNDAEAKQFSDIDLSIQSGGLGPTSQKFSGSIKQAIQNKAIQLKRGGDSRSTKDIYKAASETMLAGFAPIDNGRDKFFYPRTLDIPDGQGGFKKQEVPDRIVQGWLKSHSSASYYKEIGVTAPRAFLIDELRKEQTVAEGVLPGRFIPNFLESPEKFTPEQIAGFMRTIDGRYHEQLAQKDRGKWTMGRDALGNPSFVLMDRQRDGLARVETLPKEVLPSFQPIEGDASQPVTTNKFSIPLASIIGADGTPQDIRLKEELVGVFEGRFELANEKNRLQFEKTQRRNKALVEKRRRMQEEKARKTITTRDRK